MKISTLNILTFAFFVQLFLHKFSLFFLKLYRTHVKEGGKTGSLGIPTVVDRLVQQSNAQVLSRIYEVEFHTSSQGFRPQRICQTVLKEVMGHLEEGYAYVVDLDLEKFFDTVNYSRLIEPLSRKVKDPRVISLIHKYLTAGVVMGNKFEESEIGVPQGGPLSPLLSNIMLHELDKELAKRGHRFVRYPNKNKIQTFL